MSKEQPKIGIASDHAGYQMKEFLIGYLDALGYDVYDFGCNSDQSCDYPDYAHPMARAMVEGEIPRAISICGSGNGISMTMNKYPSIRAALCWIPEIAALSRGHNDANVCSLPARFIDNETAVQIVDAFLNTPFDGGRHKVRIDKIPIPECEC